MNLLAYRISQLAMILVQERMFKERSFKLLHSSSQEFMISERASTLPFGIRLSSGLLDLITIWCCAASREGKCMAIHLELLAQGIELATHNDNGS